MSRNSPLPQYHQIQPPLAPPGGYEAGWRGPPQQPQLQIQPPGSISSPPQFYSPNQQSYQQLYNRPVPQQQQQQPQYNPMFQQPRPQQQQAQYTGPPLHPHQLGPAPPKTTNNIPGPSPNPYPNTISNGQQQQQQSYASPINRRPDTQSMLLGKPRSYKIQPEAASAPINPSDEELTIYEMPGAKQQPFRPQQPSSSQPPPPPQVYSRPQSQQSIPIQLAPPKPAQLSNRISPPPMLSAQPSYQHPQQYNKTASPPPPPPIMPHPQPQPQSMLPTNGIQTSYRASPPPPLLPPPPLPMMLSTTSLSSSSQQLHPSQFELHPPAANSTPLTTTTNPMAFNRSPIENTRNMRTNNNQPVPPSSHNHHQYQQSKMSTKSALDKFMEKNEFSVYSTEIAKKYLSDLNSITLLKTDFDETPVEPSYLQEDMCDKTLMPTTFDKKPFRKFEESSVYFGSSSIGERDENSISDIKLYGGGGGGGFNHPPPLHNKPFNPHFYTDNCINNNNKYNDSVPVSIEDIRLDNSTRFDFYAGGGMSSLNISTSTAKNSNYGADDDHKYEEYRHRYMKDDGSEDEKWLFPKETETDFNNRFNNNNNNNNRRFSPRDRTTSPHHDSRGVSPPSDAECNNFNRNIPIQIIDVDAVMKLPKLL